ncbi:choice-of-anchor A family protein [Duganella aquatilis]|nr:choice-of-anchor A family protein [Duganella aquatilis]
MARVFPMTALALAALYVTNVQAATPAPLTATQMLQQFNLVVSKDLTSTSHVQGRTFVGGDAVAQDFVQKPAQVAASNYAGVTVLGNMSGNNNDAHVDALGLYVGGSTNKVIVNKGDAYIGGSATGGGFSDNTWVNGTATDVNQNGAFHASSSNRNINNPLAAETSTMLTNKAAATSTNFGQVMTGLSTQLSALKGTKDASVSIDDATHSKVTFTGTANSSGLLVFDLTGATDGNIFSSNITDFYFNLTGATTVIFNTDDKNLTLNANFQNAESNGSKFIWNFAGAQSVTVGRTFGGQVLVADGTFSNINGANVEGGVYAKNVNEYGQIHIQAFSGAIPAAVPEPETYAMLLAGLGIVGFIGRRRQKAAAAR